MDLQSLIKGFAVSDLLLIATVTMTVIAVFIVARTLYPEGFVEDVQHQAADRRKQAVAGGMRGMPPPAPPGRLRSFGAAFVHKIGNMCDGMVKPAKRDRLQLKYTSMGQPELRAEDFVAHQLIWAILFGVLGLMTFNVLQRPLAYATSFAIFGFFFPHIWLRDQILKRQKAIRRALPYHIDLLTLSVEAGLDFQAGLATVVSRGKHGPLIEELALTLNEIKLGKTRAEALRNLAERVQISDISAFVANVIQADKMGTDLGKVLRIQTTQMRVNRTHRAEKLANEAPVKMIFPLVLCIFPTVFFVLFGPIVYRLMYAGG